MPLDKSSQEGLDFGAGHEDQNKLTPNALIAWTPQQWAVSSDWQALVFDFLASKTGLNLAEFVASRLTQGAVIYPEQPFWALELTSLAQVKVVILGQDPYHGEGQAQGLAFSVPNHVKTPPSLRNILKEIERDSSLVRAATPHQGEASLVSWAQQGVLLLNTVLTVEAGQPASHAGKGWEDLTNQIVEAVAKKAEPIVFMLWGKHAQSKIPLIESAQDVTGKSPGRKHLILTANHPSPLSATRKPHPFVGCGHFHLANEFLQKNGAHAVDWSTGIRK